jgi:protein TonB
MKLKFFVAAAGLAFFALNASAQSDAKIKTKVKTETPAATEPTEATEAAPQKSPEPIAPGADKAGGKAAGKAIPVAQYYEGGQAAMYEFINSNLQYPPGAKRNRIQGQCIVSLTLNADGTTTNMRILKNMGAGTGEEALRVVRLLKFNAPGYSVQSSIPVTFKL